MYIPLWKICKIPAYTFTKILKVTKIKKKLAAKANTEYFKMYWEMTLGHTKT